MTAETVAEQAGTLAKDGADPKEAVAALSQAASGDRRVVEAARDLVATRIRGAVDDFDATAALTLLNRALAQMPRHDPMDWRVRWAKRRKP